MEISVDMLRLQVEVFDEDWFEFYKMFLETNADCKFYVSSRLQNYAYNYSIQESMETGIPKQFYNRTIMQVNKFWLGFNHNSEKANKLKHVLVIEFNPNKCDMKRGMLRKILMKFFSKNSVFVKSLDIAIDLKDVQMKDIIFSRGSKRKFKDFNTDLGRTLYFGERGQNGAVKIYDKGKEQKVDIDWVRYEITLKPNLPMSVCREYKQEYIECDIPNAMFLDNRVIKCTDAKLRSAILCIIHGYMVLEDFAYDFRKKIKTYLGNMSYIKIDTSIKENISNTILAFSDTYCKAFLDI